MIILIVILFAPLFAIGYVLGEKLTVLSVELCRRVIRWARKTTEEETT